MDFQGKHALRFIFGVIAAVGIVLFSGGLLCALLLLLCEAPEWARNTFYAAVGIAAVPVLFLFYFQPSIIAQRRNHPHAESIQAVNLLLGWTLVGYVVALAWALTVPEPPDAS